MTASGATVSVIGLGNMGRALAEALLRSGRTLTVWNRTASKCAPLHERGATPARSVSSAIADTDAAIVCI